MCIGMLLGCFLGQQSDDLEYTVGETKNYNNVQDQISIVEWIVWIVVRRL